MKFLDLKKKVSWFFVVRIIFLPDLWEPWYTYHENNNKEKLQVFTYLYFYILPLQYLHRVHCEVHSIATHFNILHQNLHQTHIMSIKYNTRWPDFSHSMENRSLSEYPTMHNKHSKITVTLSAKTQCFYTMFLLMIHLFQACYIATSFSHKVFKMHRYA